MGNHDNREFSGKGAQRFEQFCFRSDIERASRFVEENQRRPMIKSPGKAETLAFSPRQADAALSDGSLKSVPQFQLDKVDDLSHGTDFSQAHSVDVVVGHPERDIASDRVVDKEKFLRDIPDRSLP